jgi:hypothetical protein
MGDFSDDYGGYDILGLYEQRDEDRRAQRAKLLTPPQRPWVGLTEEQIKTTWSQLWRDINQMKLASGDKPQKETIIFLFARATEQALKEKNT